MKTVKNLVTLSMGAATFLPRAFQVRASKNAEAPLVDVTFRVPVEEAQKLVDEAKKNGAKAVRTESTDYGTTVTYVVKPNEDGGKGAFQF